MMCGHCVAHVKKALEAIEGVSAEVSLDDKAAYVTAAAEVSDDILTKAVVDAGYEVTGIESRQL
jgi:copper chaperone CopZ